jgi:hypothetical protein
VTPVLNRLPKNNDARHPIPWSISSSSKVRREKFYVQVTSLGCVLSSLTILRSGLQPDVTGMCFVVLPRSVSERNEVVATDPARAYTRFN